MEKYRSITGISLGGFQVFDELTHIPLGKLSLFFGPNSVGKSAIEDAIRIFSIFDSIPSGRSAPKSYFLMEGPFSIQWVLGRDNFHHLRDEFKASWRKVGTPARFVPEMHMHVRARTYFDPCFNTGSSLINAKKSQSGWTNYEIQYRFFQEESSDTDPDDLDETFRGLSFVLAVLINDQIALVYNHTLMLALINNEHPSISDIKFESDFQALQAAYPQTVTANKGALAFSMVAGFNMGGWTPNDDSGFVAVLKEESRDPKYLSALREFSDVFGYILANVRLEAEGDGHGPIIAVPASRTTPTSKELTFYQGEEWLNRNLADDWTYRFPRLPRILRRQNRISSADFYRVLDTPATLAAVNDALSEHLFIEKGYRIVRDGYVVLTDKVYGKLCEGQSKWASIVSGKVSKFHLEDAEGSRFQFDEVGSGLGYVLPVLCAICNDSGEKANRATIIVQQPELHLHPALQASLADAFIEASGRNHQIVVETHSEHFLLRLLKRIRQTAAQQSINEKLKLDADDLVVLYFNPMPGGSTQVLHLRLSRDGEFMDRWPRGFFSERDAELFDE